MRGNPALRPPATGFTLVEVMIVIAILAILASLAWPAYQKSVQRSRRADGMAALATIQQAQERWRAVYPTYQSDLTLLRGASDTVSPDGHYSLSVVADSASGSAYTVRATARSTSPQAADSTCQVLQVAMSAGTIVYSSLGSGGVANGTPDPCWVR